MNESTFFHSGHPNFYISNSSPAFKNRFKWKILSLMHLAGQYQPMGRGSPTPEPLGKFFFDLKKWSDLANFARFHSDHMNFHSYSDYAQLKHNTWSLFCAKIIKIQCADFFWPKSAQICLPFCPFNHTTFDLTDRTKVQP